VAIVHRDQAENLGVPSRSRMIQHKADDQRGRDYERFLIENCRERVCYARAWREGRKVKDYLDR
jgi:hypothetical protein